MREGFSFEVLAESGDARRGRFRTPRATIETPVFMPVGTQAAVKTQTPAEVEATGARIILANTYHLWLRPGAELIDRLGGAPRFMGWDHAMLTDSGGFQIFSLAKLRKIEEEGVSFRSHLDGRKLLMTPEESMRVQRLLRSDVAMLLDICPPGAAPEEEIREAIRITNLWADRCLKTEPYEGQARFGIVQGGTYEHLRLEHLDHIASLPVDGVALGGFSVGEPVERMYELLEVIGPRMPKDRPRYLMGVGTPIDLIIAMGAGIDLFDCVLPTRNARNGQALTFRGRVNLKQARHAEDESPLEEGCACDACQRYTRAYLRHLMKAGEQLGGRLLTQHNLHFYGELTRRARSAIEAGDYAKWAAQAIEAMREGDEIASR